MRTLIVRSEFAQAERKGAGVVKQERGPFFGQAPPMSDVLMRDASLSALTPNNPNPSYCNC